ncbi:MULTISPECIES: hypothetical protein [unclassified Brevibacterium]|uniref:hypothetical protein n=1 Tax=unclassified Brevibacterium TaxID=2614124 RepID=UPI001093324D|nr:hypothetical protein [Brevibacterium sp. S22]
MSDTPSRKPDVPREILDEYAKVDPALARRIKVLTTQMRNEQVRRERRMAKLERAAESVATFVAPVLVMAGTLFAMTILLFPEVGTFIGISVSADESPSEASAIVSVLGVVTSLTVAIHATIISRRMRNSHYLKFLPPQIQRFGMELDRQRSELRYYLNSRVATRRVGKQSSD